MLSSSLIIASVIAERKVHVRSRGGKIDRSREETRDLMAAGASTSRGVGVEEHPNNRTEIVFFDVETSIPSARGQGHELLEFGAILVCPRKLEELDYYSTLIRPYDLSCVSAASVRCNGITRDAVSTAPTFLDVADRVYDILHGRVWAGHNIARFDCPRIREAFARINRSPPEPKGIIDSLALLTQRFGKRAGNMKMATLASYFGLGQQTHRSLDDVRMNLEVVKYCATVLFLESSLPDIPTVKKLPIPVGNTTTRSHANTASSSSQDASSSALPGDDAKGRALTTNAEPTELPARPSSAQLASIDPFDLSRFVDELKPDAMQVDATPTYKGPREVEPEALTQGPAEGCSSSPEFLEPHEISLASISASLGASHWGHQRINLLHKGSLLQIRCSKSNVRFGVSSKFLDHAGRPRLSIVVDASPVLCAVLDKCDQLAQQLFDDNAGSSEWRAVINRKNGFSNFPPTIRLHIPTVSNGEATVYATELYQRQPNGALQTLTFADVTLSDLEALLSPGALVDADFCLDFYDYLQHAGIRLVARRLFVHPKSATKEYASPA